MTGFIDDPEASHPWRHDRTYVQMGDDLRIRYESQGNLGVQTVVLMTSVESLMEKTNALLEKLNATMDKISDTLDEISIRPHYTYVDGSEFVYPEGGGEGSQKDGESA